MLKREYLDKFNPDLTKMLETYGDSLSSKFKCHRVGIITSFNSERKTVNVRLLDKMIFRDMVEDYTELADIPLLIQGVGDSQLTFGDVVGAECLVHFNDTDIDLWFATGESYEPNTARVHDFNDGFAELRPFSLPNNFDYDMQSTMLRRGNCKIRLLTDGSIEITNGSAILTMTENNVNITANVNITGNVNIVGDSKMTGNVTIEGETSHTGNVSVDGQITATGEIKSDVDVKATAISLLAHTHGGVTPGSGSTGAPQ